MDYTKKHKDLIAKLFKKVNISVSMEQRRHK